MGRYYSKELRTRCVLAVKREGMPCRSAAGRFGVAPSTVIGWVKAYRATGSFAPCAQGHPPEMKIAPFTDVIGAFMQGKDNTLTRPQAALLGEHGAYASRTWTCRGLILALIDDYLLLRRQDYGTPTW